MSMFSRLSNLVRGFLSLFMGGMEKKNPEAVYQATIDQAMDRSGKLKQVTASIIRRREDIATRLSDKQKALATVMTQLDQAVETNADELGALLMQKKDSLDAEIATLTGQLEEAKAEAERAVASLMEVRSQVENLRDEKDSMVARHHAAQARMEIQEQLDNLSNTASSKALDNVRTNVRNLEAQAKLGDEIAGADINTKLKTLTAEGNKAQAARKFEELKAARQQKQAPMAVAEGVRGGDGEERPRTM